MSSSSPVSRCLGKAPAQPDARVPALSTLLTGSLSAPVQDEWYSDVGDLGMLANDSIGDCVPAAILHHIQQRKALTGDQVSQWSPTDQETIALYSALTGYVPGQAGTDQGTVVSSALESWLTKGIPLSDGSVDQIQAYASLNWQSPGQMCKAIHWCGGVILGLMLPTVWMDSDYLFDLSPDITGPKVDITGGHCILAVGYTPTALGIEYDVISWGQRFRLTDRALSMLGDEAYAVLDWDWLDTDGLNPAGVDKAQAQLAMNQIRSTPNGILA